MLNQVFPIAFDLNLGSGNRRNRRNALSLHETLVNFLRTSTDKSSLYHQMLEEGEITFEEILNDLKGTLMAGFDTTARGTITTLYRLLKNPRALHLLRTAVRERVKVDKHASVDEAMTRVVDSETLNDIDYLGNAIKEALRMDTPTTVSISYKVVKDC